MKYKAGFIGAGNMGGALLRAVSKKTDKICVYDKNAQAAHATGADFCEIKDLVQNSEYVFLGVKPNVIESVCKSIKDFLSDENVIVSMAAGIDTKSLKSWLGTENVIRIMPNTPASVGEGMILFTGSASDDFTDLMSECGKLDYIDEKLIDAAAALSGCGPAFVYMFIEALADGAVSCGLPRAKAELYAKQTVLGSSKLALLSDKHLGALKDAVCSPGGTTIEGVLTLEKGAFRSDVANAVIAAFNKTSKLK